MPRFAAVLGCGPAGLLAAEALQRNSFNVNIYSLMKKSQISGAQYLHCAIPEITNVDPDFHLKFVKLGTRDGYAQKVYGNPEAECSWDEFEGSTVGAWSMQTAYETLWRRWESRIHGVDVDTRLVRELVRGHGLVVSTIPVKVLCSDHYHKFPSQKVWIADHAQPGTPPNSIVYNGRMGDWWYRTSDIQGHASTEASVPLMGARIGYKPLDTDCGCMPEVLRAGRFGRWQKGVLVHHVWEEINALFAV